VNPCWFAAKIIALTVIANAVGAAIFSAEPARDGSTTGMPQTRSKQLDGLKPSSSTRAKFRFHEMVLDAAAITTGRLATRVPIPPAIFR
jgi:hypothetical protein